MSKTFGKENIEQYWCNCGAGAVGTLDEHEYIHDWVQGHREECNQGRDEEPEQEMHTGMYCTSEGCNTPLFGADNESLGDALEFHLEEHANPPKVEYETEDGPESEHEDVDESLEDHSQDNAPENDGAVTADGEDVSE